MQLYSYYSAKSFCKSSKYRLWWISILVIGLFSGMGHVYADTSENALYIDEKGNIGMRHPTAVEYPRDQGEIRARCQKHHGEHGQ